MTLEAITFDFGNTLVPVPAAGLRGVVAVTADRIAAELGPFDRESVLEAWAQERERQFREEVPRFREVDLAERVVRILARLRGMEPPPADRRWDDADAARRSSPEEVAWAVEVYSRAFVESLPPHLKLKGFKGKYLHKKALEKWVPEQVVYSKKKGFDNPIDQWLRSRMKSFATECLLGEGSAAGRYFDRGYIHELLTQHDSGVRNHLRHLYLLISFELWHRRFIGT